MTLEYLIVDKESGEIVDNGTLKDGESIKINKPLQHTQKEHLKNDWNKRALTKALGGFVTVFYYNNELLYHNLDISRATITRLMMLATYINFDNELVNDEKTKENIYNEIAYLTRKELQDILGLKDTSFKRFYKEVVDTNLLIKCGEKFVLNKEYFLKGKIDKETTHNYTRMYVETVRQIYNSIAINKHNTLSYVFQLIPCVHYSTNFLCFNSASSYKEAEYMNLKDVCAFLGLSLDVKNMKKFKKDLIAIHIEHNEEKYHLFNEVTFSSSTQYKQRFLVNPLLVTSSSSHDNIRDMLKSLFVG